MNIRTDLALESVNATKVRDGITKISRGKAFKVTEIKIAEDRHGVPIGKKKGRYITLEGAPLGRFSESFKDMACELSEELSQLVPKGPALVIGLGNNDITPDALGPQAASRVLATRHLREELGSEDEFLSGLRQVSVMASGVLGQTGIETAEIIEGLLEKLRGMFAFAIWDEADQSLFCARDPFGIKPFYYYTNAEGELLFGSEIKSFLPHPGFVKELNEERLELYLTYQYSPGEDTFFKGVKKLLPAHWLLGGALC